jgi:S-adenosylmethionine hydrolase
MTRIVTLLTDFGVADPYVAELKGAMLRHWGDRQAPEPWPRFVDLCHKIPAGDIEAAACAYFRGGYDSPCGCRSGRR